jgi:hypothetical protein
MNAEVLRLLPLLLATSRLVSTSGLRAFVPHPSSSAGIRRHASVVIAGSNGVGSHDDEREYDDDVIIGGDDESRGMIGRGGRRSFLSMAGGVAAVGTALSTTTAPWDAHALPSFSPFLGNGDDGGGRRQLELCLSTVLRTEYWAANVSRSLGTSLNLLPSRYAARTPSSSPPIDESTTMYESDYMRKRPYLEARLGAKALLTGKIGGGANSRVIELGGYQLRGCLEDASYWCYRDVISGGGGSKNDVRRICNMELSSASEDLVESLASVVEFDGLETTIDPSPRSSLMLGMYTNEKAKFVYRTLVERVMPSCERVLGVFGTERRRTIETYVSRDHPDDVPIEVLERMFGEQTAAAATAMGTMG